ncbi:MAG TPA: MFS transporter [Candidatus Saccharimonadales bacterium]
MIPRHKRLLQKRLKPLYIAMFFQGFVLWYPVEKLFMTRIGFNDETVAIETMILTVVMIVVNIPVGVIADRWSRKGILITASVALMACDLLGGLSHGFWIYVASAACWGIFSACNSGVYDSVVYDTLIEEVGTANRFAQYYGRLQFFDGIALMLGSLLSGTVTYAFGLRSAYLLTIPLSFCSIIALAYFREPKEHKQGEAPLVGAHLKIIFQSIARKGDVFWIVLTLILATANIRLMFEFDQLWLIALALPVLLYGPVNALLLTSISSGGMIAGSLKQPYTIFAAGIILVMSSLCLLTRQRLLIIIAQTILLTGYLAFQVVFGKYLHDTLPSKIRVGASSVVTTVGYVLFLPAAFVFGEISKRLNIFHAAWVIIGIVIAMVISANVAMLSRPQRAGNN